jgi:hypothetical protein
MMLMPSLQAFRLSEAMRLRSWRDGPLAATMNRLPLLLLLTFLFVIAVVASCVSEPHTMVSATVNTEYARTRVLSPQDGSFRVASARVGEECVREVFVEPAAGAVIGLTRPDKSELLIDVLGASAWHSPHHKDNARQVQARHLRLAIDNRAGCESGRFVRLPFKGIAMIGKDLQEVSSDFEQPQLALRSGQLAIYGRSILDWNLGPFQARALYLSQTMSVPAGSRIAAAYRDKPSHAAATGHGDDNSSPWYGFADVDFGEDGPPGLTIEASTNARFIEIYPPAPFRVEGQVDGTRPDVVALSLAARLTGDPNVLWLMGLFTVVGGLVAWGVMLWMTGR